MSLKLSISLFVIFLCNSFSSLAQNAEELFSQARTAAFEQKQYPLAKRLAKAALQKSPNYYDIRIFLGRIYAWEKQADSARREFDLVLQQKADIEDAYVAYANLEFWNDNSERALLLSNQGLGYFPSSVELAILKAKFLNDLKKWTEANQVISDVLVKYPTQADVRALAIRIRENIFSNRIGVNYTFVSFDKQFDDPWYLTSLDYSRQTSLGSLIGRVNYANRFNENGIQFEVDAYPRLSNTFMAYVSGGYSPNLGVFPQSRAGFSLYANLPKSMEAEAGFRYLQFSDNTWIYTASLGKYYKSYWFNLRTYLTPSSGQLSQSFAFTTRYYVGGTDDFLSLVLSTGLSPDDQRNIVLINASAYKLQSTGLTLGYRRSINSFHIINFKASWTNQEYRKDTRGNAFELGVGYIRRF
ncbi:YaiO family outer membrane beta-barrel protein [Cytophagaceae bacterium 50C-KIRBA]|uniref:YaiO family outer membrane beta-barrel protein n=1 Tax=Aquirufa beregesia TaxID=2516556 RepID=A0ABX0ESD9_9BACT|nr:YaiO family outer membrane beta-barrel protein [Aquirufa beregesia]